jgi:hypothetical protein
MVMNKALKKNTCHAQLLLLFSGELVQNATQFLKYKYTLSQILKKFSQICSHPIKEFTKFRQVPGFKPSFILPDFTITYGHQC